MIHDYLSKFTELRKKCLPYDGTLDFWVLLFITVLNILAVIGGIWFAIDGTIFFSDRDEEPDAYKGGNFFTIQGDDTINLKLIATVFAMIEATPGLLFIWYCLVFERAAWTLKIWVPLVICTISALLIFVEIRVAVNLFGDFTVSLVNKGGDAVFNDNSSG